MNYAGRMERTFPEVKFERYADDIVINCKSKEQSEQIEQALNERLKECGLISLYE